MRREIAVTASASLQLCSRGDGRWGGTGGWDQPGGLGWQIGDAAQCGAGFGDVQGAQCAAYGLRAGRPRALTPCHRAEPGKAVLTQCCTPGQGQGSAGRMELVCLVSLLV